MVGVMNRAERRRLAKESFVKTDPVIRSQMDKVKDELGTYYVETLMTCFALAEHEVHKFGQGRVMKSLRFIDELMGKVGSGEVTVDELKQKLADEVKVSINV